MRVTVSHVRPLRDDLRHVGAWCMSATCWVLAMLFACAPRASAQPAVGLCGELSNAYGPFDFRTDRDKLPIVEIARFTPEVESLVRGSRGYLGGDLDYTLRAFPNHHRALLSMMRYGARLKLPRVPGANYDVECYFTRALTFRPNDNTVRMIYALFLNGNQRKDEALQHLKTSRDLAGDNPFTHYNLGMIYMDIGEAELALTQAHTAVALGFVRTELKGRLVAAGKWADAAASAPR